MKRVNNWLVCAVLLLGIGFIVLHRDFSTSVQAQSPNAPTSCSNATLHGAYVFGFSGYSGTANTPLAFAGREVYDGNGKTSGVTTNTTAGQVSTLTFTGTYKVNSDCTATETDTYENGTIGTYNDYTGPSGNKVTFIETDRSAVDAGSETRVSESGSD